MRSPSFTQRDDADDGQSTAAMKPRTHTATPTTRTAGPLCSARCPLPTLFYAHVAALYCVAGRRAAACPVTQKGGGTPRQFEGRGERDMATATMRPADDVKVSRATWRAPPSHAAGTARARVDGGAACAGALNGRAWRGGRPGALCTAPVRRAPVCPWGGAV